MRPFGLLITLMIAGLLAACGGQPAPEATVTPTLVPSSTPPPAVPPNAYDNVTSTFTEQGFPALGREDAPVTIFEFGSYDSNASLQSHDEIFAPLFPRIEAGEVRYIYAPLSGTGSAENGVGAARAALCAGEQGAYWPYHDRLFALLGAAGDTAYTGNALLNLADEVGLDRDAWNACVAGDRPQTVLDAASAAALDEETYSGTPTILVNGNYVLNDYISISTIIDQMLVRVDTETGVVGNLSTPVYENPEDVPEVVEVAPITLQELDSPIDITLPGEWAVSFSDTLVLQDIDALRTVPFTLYKGPVEGGTGSIVMLWGFPSLVAGNPLAAEAGVETPDANLWTDGLRMLRLAVVEVGCNVGTDDPRNYEYAGFTGVGTEWSAVNCPELPDTRGWFIGTQHEGINFLFYAYIDPIDPMGMTDAERVARQQIAGILESIVFRPLDVGSP
jgi:protein-disulfide isomerase